MPKRPTSRNTKAEILEQFNKLFEENKKLMRQMEQLQKDKAMLEKQVPSVQEPPKPNKREADELRKEKKTVDVKLNAMDSIISNLKEIRSGFGKAVNELSAVLVAEASTLAELLNRVETEKQQIETLYDIEITDDTLKNVIQQYTEKSTTFEEELQQKQQSFDQQMAENQKSWHKEQEEHARLVKERNESAELNLQREEAEYKYNLELRRKLDNEEFQSKLKKLNKELEFIETEQKKEWAEREKVIAEQEQEFNELKQRVEDFPQELETAIKKAKTKSSEIASREVKKNADLRAKEVEGENKVYELKIKSLEDIVKTQIQQIQSLSAKLEATLKQGQILATKSIEGASQVSSFQSVKEIALEQAKQIQKSK